MKVYIQITIKGIYESEDGMTKQELEELRPMLIMHDLDIKEETLKYRYLEDDGIEEEIVR